MFYIASSVTMAALCNAVSAAYGVTHTWWENTSSQPEEWEKYSSLCEIGVMHCDIFVSIIDPQSITAGTMYEMGMAAALDKTSVLVYLYKPDRTSPKEFFLKHPFWAERTVYAFEDGIYMDGQTKYHLASLEERAVRIRDAISRGLEIQRSRNLTLASSALKPEVLNELGIVQAEES